MATSFVQDLRRGVLRGLEGKADRGWMPNRAPLGYRNNAITKEIEIDPERFEMVRKAWDMLLTGGMTIAEVFREAKGMGLTCYTRVGTPKLISQPVFYNIFSNPFYMGQFKFRGGNATRQACGYGV